MTFDSRDPHLPEEFERVRTRELRDAAQRVTMGEYIDRRSLEANARGRNWWTVHRTSLLVVAAITALGVVGTVMNLVGR